jgi:hypothetical protein
MTDAKLLHEKALGLVGEYRKCETLLLEVLCEIDSCRAFESFGYANLFQYCTDALRLSEAQSYALIGIARKSREVPALKEKIEKGEIHVSNARRIVPILNAANQDVWLAKAEQLSQRQLEQEIVREFPRLEMPERMRPLNAERSELRMGISRDLERKLERVRDVLSQKKRAAVNLESALNELVDAFLAKEDPIEKAKRARLVARPNKETVGRRPLPAATVHQIALRDEGRCTAVLPSGQQCGARRWFHVHHLKPVALGGSNSLDNLTTLCEGHHRGVHRAGLPETVSRV